MKIGMEVMDNWCIPCVNEGDESKPSPEELEALYRRLEAGELLELSWKCPGRRLPSPATKDDSEAVEAASTDTSVKNLEFDFMDDSAPTTTPTSTMRVRTQNSTLKGSAKKKTANFASVMDAMKRNKQSTPNSAAKK